MLAHSSMRVMSLILGVGCVVLLGGCTSRNVSATAQDKTFVPGPQARAQVEPVPAPAVPPQEVAKPAPVPPPSAPSSAPSLELADVYFDYDKSTIRSDAASSLEGNARQLKDQRGWSLMIEGHCDERGTVDYNLVLGEKRARAVQKYLEDLGIPSSNVQIVSYGKERPSCVEHSDDCWQKNRRAHFVKQ
jgi:peptidoglycan-associated lipoprotein